MNSLKAGSISRNLVLLVVAAVLPALVILLYSGVEHRRLSIDSAQQDVLLLTRSMAESQKDMTGAARQILSTLSLLPAIREGNMEMSEKILEAVFEQNPDFQNITLTDPQGRVLISGGAYTPANLSDRKHFQEALAEERFAAGEYIITRVGDNRPAFAFAHPVMDRDGQPWAVLTAAVSLSRFAHFHEASNLPDRSFLAITDHQGIRLFFYPPMPETNPVGRPIISHSWETARGAEEPAVFFGQGSDGMHRIFAVKPVRLVADEKPYIYLWASIPESHVLGPANAVMLRNLLLLVLATAISIAVACFLGRKNLVGPITGLVNLTRRFADGQLDARLTSAGTQMPTEIATLTRAFHDMASKLEASGQVLRENEARFRLLMNSLDALVYVADMETYEILFINETGKQIFGDITGKLCWQSLQKNQQGPCDFCTNQYLLDENGQPAGIYHWEMENTLTGQWFDIRDRAIKWVDGRVVRLEVATDITSRKQAENRLAEETQRLEVTLKSIGDGVISTNTESRVTLINQAAESITGWSSQEAVGLPLSEVFTLVEEGSGEPCQNPVERVLATGGIVELERQAILRSRDGREINVADSAAPIKDLSGEIIGVVMVFRDITQQLRTDQELVKIKKLESIGALAGGLAHDFNNILTAIRGNIELSLLDSQLPDNTRYLLQEAVKACQRAQELTRQLLTFAKGGQPIRQAASLAEVIRDSADFVLRGSKTACRYLIPDDLWLVDIDKGQISQVVQNLILNASEAMPEGGVIEVACDNILAAETGEVALPGRGDYVKMSVKDHGVGIPANALDRIFDPYFSTKKLGSGLGLAICHSIVSKHDGRITVRSTPGSGTTFEVYLPVSTQAAADVEKPRETEAGAEKARILVMDDEEMIRQVSRAVLGRLGHQVLLAEDGDAAVRIYREAMAQEAPIDLMIMDLTIPGGKGGKETIKEILALDPAAKVVVASGYSHDPIMANYADYGFSAALAKPFDLRELTRVVNRLLG